MIALDKFICHPIKCLSVGPQNKKCPYFKSIFDMDFFFVTGPLCENYDSWRQSSTTPMTLELEKVLINNPFTISTKISSYFSYINSEAHCAKILKCHSRGPRNRKSPHIQSEFPISKNFWLFENSRAQISSFLRSLHFTLFCEYSEVIPVRVGAESL